MTRLLLRVFGGPNSPPRKRFGNFDRAAKQVHTFPPESDYLANPHPSEHSNQRYGITWLRQHCEKLLYLIGRVEPALGLDIRFTNADTVRRILVEVAALDGGLQHRRKRGANAANRGVRVPLPSQVR